VLVKTLVIDSESSGIAAAGSAEDKMIPQETIRMAAVVVAMLPILIVYPFLQKYFAKGVMLGSIKG
jgi:putative aldouronate transport system permease protein